MTPALSTVERAMLEGDHGEGAALAMRIVVATARVVGATSLLEVASAHVDGCLYHGRAGLEFAERLASLGARVAVPTTLNVSALDLVHPELFRGDEETRRASRRQMDAYVAMGCEPTWTCAPYQLPRRPAFGEHLAWAESNAIVFANSVLGARTERYGDFIDICAAVTGRVPRAGLHLPEHRRGRVVFELRGISPGLLGSDVLFPVLGHLVGREAGTGVPVIAGLAGAQGSPEVGPEQGRGTAEVEDRLKALGAAAAASGGVAMFHAVGLTPEAPTVEAALGGEAPERVVHVTPQRLAAARDNLATAADGPLGAVSVGTPHASMAELRELARAMGRAGAPVVPFFVNTGRHVLERAAAEGLVDLLPEVTFVTDTCTYITPILDPSIRTVMTNSGKWAYYAPGNIGVEVVFGSLEECVRSGAAGEVVRDDALWR